MRGRTVRTLLFCLHFLFLLSFFSCIGRYALYHSFFVFIYLFVCFSPALMKYFTQRKPVFSFRFVSFSLFKTNKQRSQQLRRRQEGQTHTHTHKGKKKLQRLESLCGGSSSCFYTPISSLLCPLCVAYFKLVVNPRMKKGDKAELFDGCFSPLITDCVSPFGVCVCVPFSHCFHVCGDW